MTDTATEIDADSAVYKTLLESTKAIPWKLDWNSMKFAYIGPQIENLLGWQMPASQFLKQTPLYAGTNEFEKALGKR